jgi:hypothetical protein
MKKELAALLRAFDILKTHFETMKLAKFKQPQVETMQAGGAPAGHS